MIYKVLGPNGQRKMYAYDSGDTLVEIDAIEERETIARRKAEEYKAHGRRLKESKVTREKVWKK